jgi:hypothetical protein
MSPFQPLSPFQPPDFSRLLNCVAVTYKDYAKLIFWSFVAGFSEKFAVDVIGGFTKTAASAES